MAAVQPVQHPPWRGAGIHGFLSKEHLLGAINPGRYLTGPEDCALLMNGGRFVSDPPPFDSEAIGHEYDFKYYVVSAPGYIQMEAFGTAFVQGHLGWLCYKEKEEARTVEKNCNAIKVNEQYSLPRREISGELRLRRRVFLPPELLAQADGEVYYVLQYCLFSNKSALDKASIMAGLVDGAAKEEAALGVDPAEYVQNVDAEAEEEAEGGQAQAEEDGAEGGQVQAEEEAAEGGQAQAEEDGAEGGQVQAEEEAAEGGQAQAEPDGAEGGQVQAEEEAAEGGQAQADQ